MILMYFLLIFGSQTLAQLSIKYSAVIYSSGPQTPINPYPADPLRNESIWQLKFGGLTDTDKRHYYALGQWFGERYLKASSKRCDSRNIFARSIDSNASVTAAQATLAGLCLPNMTNNFSNAYLSKQPITIKTIPINDDEILAMQRVCPQYVKLKEEYSNSKSYKDGLNSHKDLMGYLSEHTNRTVDNYDDLNEIYYILSLEDSNNLTLPNWTHDIFPQKLEDPACFSYSLSTATTCMARILVGPLMKEIVNNMSNVMMNLSSDVTLSIYSGNDNTIGNILSALNLFHGICPPVNATVLMELLHDDILNDYHVQITYRNTIDAPYALVIPQCGILCRFSTFTQIYGTLISVDWEAECKEDEDIDMNAAKQQEFFLVVVCLLTLGLVIIILHFVYIVKASKDNDDLSEQYDEFEMRHYD